jgi:hypothetical protein
VERGPSCLDHGEGGYRVRGGRGDERLGLRDGVPDGGCPA